MGTPEHGKKRNPLAPAPIADSESPLISDPSHLGPPSPFYASLTVTQRPRESKASKRFTSFDYS